MSAVHSTTYQIVDLEGSNPSTFTRSTTTLRTKAFDTLGKIANFCSDGTIFHALDSDRLAKDKEYYKDASYFRKVTVGVSLGVKDLIQGVVLGIILHSFVDTTSGETSLDLSSFTFTSVAIIIPLIEEIVFRLIIQNGIGFIQNAALAHAPESFKENRTFVWLTSTSCRIVVANTIFAAAHLTNGGGYLTVAGAVVQVALILFRTNQSVGYETTGSFITPVVTHMTNNAIVWFAIQSLSKTA